MVGVYSYKCKQAQQVGVAGGGVWGGRVEGCGGEGGGVWGWEGGVGGRGTVPSSSRQSRTRLGTQITRAVVYFAA